MTSILCDEAHHVNDYEQTAHFRKEGPSYGVVLFHEDYEGHGRVSARHT